VDDDKTKIAWIAALLMLLTTNAWAVTEKLEAVDYECGPQVQVPPPGPGGVPVTSSFIEVTWLITDENRKLVRFKVILTLANGQKISREQQVPRQTVDVERKSTMTWAGHIRTYPDLSLKGELYKDQSVEDPNHMRYVETLFQDGRPIKTSTQHCWLIGN
jgi:hypothetical protein